MALYDVSVLNQTTDFVSFLDAADTISGNLLVPFIVLIVFAVAMIAMTLRFDFVSSMRISSLISTIISIGFWGMNLLSVQFLLIPALLVMFSFVLAPILRSLGEE